MVLDIFHIDCYLFQVDCVTSCVEDEAVQRQVLKRPSQKPKKVKHERVHEPMSASSQYG